MYITYGIITKGRRIKYDKIRRAWDHDRAATTVLKLLVSLLERVEERLLHNEIKYEIVSNIFFEGDVICPAPFNFG